MPTPHDPDCAFIQLWQADDTAIRGELAAGLLAERAWIAPKYFYDALGSRLFQAICELPEYYPTRTEAAIFASHVGDMAQAIGQGATLIDLGAGNCAKAARLFDVLKPRQYVPIDISVEFLRDAVTLLRQRFPDIAMVGIGTDFSGSLELPAAVARQRRLFFYPGSSIGNFSPDEALQFLRRIRAACGEDEEGALLIGVDLAKDVAVLNAAYDDALGVTAAFNRNLLLHVNRLLGADFQIDDWRHRGFFNAEHARIEMHLEARRALCVRWGDGERRFAEGERIHTENSYKYTRDAFMRLLAQAGFVDARAWTDADGWFMVVHAKAKGQSR